jgi:predicted flap endonuclease-1-like 5' DNA nuclease
MNILLILLPKTAAIFEILALLLGAAIIGFVTSWFYNKSVYKKKIETIESDLNDQKKQKLQLETDKKSLQKVLSEKETEIKHLTLEVKALKALHAESVHETDDMKLKNKRTEQKLYVKDEAMNNLTHGMHLLDYNSFGTAKEEEKDDLKMISGIGPFIEERLHALDIYTFRQISKFTKKDIKTIDEAIEYFSGRIERDEWVAQAKELVNDEEKQAELLQRIRAKKSLIFYDRIGTATKEEANDLTEISGIGGWINEKLNALDIYTFRQISNFNDEDIEIVTEAIEFFPGRIERDEWIHQARELIGIEISMSEHVEQISVMKNRIYYDRLGVAHKHHANNLTQIKGISSWIEEKLNMLEIYTFKQISNLTTEDIEIISDILHISPNRINQDNWVEQALVLSQTSHKTTVNA